MSLQAHFNYIEKHARGTFKNYVNLPNMIAFTSCKGIQYKMEPKGKGRAVLFQGRHQITEAKTEVVREKLLNKLRQDFREL